MITKKFSELVMDRAKSDPSFRSGFLSEAKQSFIDGDCKTGMKILITYIKSYKWPDGDA